MLVQKFWNKQFQIFNYADQTRSSDEYAWKIFRKHYSEYKS